MDLLIYIAIGMMIILAVINLVYWTTHGREILSPHLRAVSLMMVCVTLLVFVLFGARLFLRPDVSIAYNDKLFDLYSNQTVNAQAQVVLDSKQLMGCEVELSKAYPLMFYMGRDRKIIKFKLPCDSLSPEMKTEIANATSYLREENK